MRMKAAITVKFEAQEGQPDSLVQSRNQNSPPNHAVAWSISRRTSAGPGNRAKISRPSRPVCARMQHAKAHQDDRPPEEG